MFCIPLWCRGWKISLSLERSLCSKQNHCLFAFISIVAHLVKMLESLATSGKGAAKISLDKSSSSFWLTLVQSDCEMCAFNKFRRFHIFIKNPIRAFFGISCDVCLLQGYTVKMVRMRALPPTCSSLSLLTAQQCRLTWLCLNMESKNYWQSCVSPIYLYPSVPACIQMRSIGKERLERNWRLKDEESSTSATPCNELTSQKAEQGLDEGGSKPKACFSLQLLSTWFWEASEG